MPAETFLPPKITISLAMLTAYCISTLEKAVLPQMFILGSISIGGTINKVEEPASALQISFEAGAKRILIGSSALMMGRFLFTLTQEHRNHKVLALRSPFHEKAAPGAQPSLL